jgi:hypothetical protein
MKSRPSITTDRTVPTSARFRIAWREIPTAFAALVQVT